MTAPRGGPPGRSWWLVPTLVALVRGHECVHDALQRRLNHIVPHSHRFLSAVTEQSYNLTRSQHGRLLQAGATYSPIRITVDTSSLDAGA